MDSTSKNGDKKIRFTSFVNGSSNNGDEQQQEDRLSSLPDILLADILSLLPIESAVATSALSSRWRHLWTQLPDLRFHCFRSPKPATNDSSGFPHFFSTVDHIFRQLSSSPELRSFRLAFPFSPATYDPQSCWSSIESWIRQVCDRNPHEINVSVDTCFSDPVIPFPCCVFECRSLITLELGRVFNFNLPVNGIISLPNLKKLNMHLHDVDRELMGILFKSCPLLEYLKLWMLLMEDEHLVDISARCLKHLTLKIEGKSRHTQFVIHAPKLEEIAILTSCKSSYRFVENSSGLLDADVHVWIEWDNGSVSDVEQVSQMSEIFQGISNVRSLHLNGTAFNSFKYLKDGCLPVFRNLNSFSTMLIDPNGFNDLLRFLRWSPSLEVLVLEKDDIDVIVMNWSEPHSLPDCVLSKFKELKFKKLTGTNEDLQFLLYILSNASALERLQIGVSNYDYSQLCHEFMFCEKLFSHPRSSLNCEIKFKGDCLIASSKGFKNGLIDCQIRSGSVCHSRSSFIRLD